MPTLSRLPQILERTRLSKSTLRRMIERGDFPSPVRLTGMRAIAWRDDEVSAWIESREPKSPGND